MSESFRTRLVDLAENHELLLVRFRTGAATADLNIGILGSVDILGRLFRCQQELKACRPVRDVSRLNVEIDKTN